MRMQWMGLGALVAVVGLGGPLPAPQSLPHTVIGNIEHTGFAEPSDIVFHSGRRTLFLVGDGGDLGEMKTDGTMLRSKRVRHADFEGVTFDPATGLVYVGIEGAERILEIEPDTFKVLREFELPRTYRGVTVMKAGGQGIEAIAFLPDPTHPEGGTFFVANQCFSADLVEDRSALYQVGVPLRSLAGTNVPVRIHRMIEPGVLDLAAICVDRKTGHLLVASDTNNLMLEMTYDGRVLSVYRLPGEDQEGLALDDDDHLYIAQDCGGVLKIRWLRGASGGAGRRK